MLAKKVLMSQPSGGGVQSAYIAEFQKSGPVDLTTNSAGVYCVSGLAGGGFVVAFEDSSTAHVIKCDADANVDWSRNITGGRPEGLFVDSGGKISVWTPTFPNNIEMTVLNSSGTSLGGTRISNGSGQNIYAWNATGGLPQETSSYIYWPGYQYGAISSDSGRSGSAIRRTNKSTYAYDTSYYCSSAGGTNRGIGSGVDGSGNMYIAGYTTDDSFSVNVAKLNSSGVKQFNKRYSGTFIFGNAAVFDGSGNCYITGRNVPGNDNLYVLAIDNTGAISWAKQLVGTYNSTGGGICLTSGGKIAVTGWYRTNNARWSAYVGVLETDGTFVWDNVIDNSSGNMYNYHCDIDGNGQMYSRIRNDAEGTGTVLSINPDADFPITAGTYGNYVVTEPNFTYSSFSPNNTNVGYTIGTPSYSATTHSRTVSSASTVVTKTTL